MQQELYFHGFVWENDVPVGAAIEDSSVQQRRNIAVNGLHITSNAPCNFTDGYRTCSAENLEKLPAFCG